ncbi:MAG: right-handed parallel beta-helix repeat-containing protein, partial [Kiritimatiellia bacterium]
MEQFMFASVLTLSLGMVAWGQLGDALAPADSTRPAEGMDDDAEVLEQYRQAQELGGVPERTTRDIAQRFLRRARAAMKARDYTGARKSAAVAAEPAMAVDSRSLACLYIAESYVQEKNFAAAKTELAKLLAIPNGAEGHRWEARERLREIERLQAGQPAVEPAAARTVVPAVAKFAAELFVSPDGNDKNAGTRAAPVASLVRARDLVRQLHGRGERGAIAVNVLAGEYPLTASVELSAEDSGTAQGPVVYRAVQPGKTVLYGGRRLTGFKPADDPAILARLPEEARGKVQRCDLRALGLTDYGRLAMRGFSQPCPPPTVELFVNGKPMTLARWPNTGFVGIRKLVASGNKQAGTPSIIEYADDRHARWAQAKDPWLFGYFNRLWADATIAVSKIDPANRTVVCNDAYQATWTSNSEGMNTHEGIQYYAFNLLEEIDLPGEWYLDRETGVLYLYPPVELAGAAVELGMFSAPMMTMTNVTDIRLEGLTFDLGRCDGLALMDCRRVLIAGCTVSRMAENGIRIRGGETNGILSCDIHTIGRRAIELIGGDRETLKPGRHFVENCSMHNFGRIDRTYTPAVQLEGVGNRVVRNRIYDCPSSVMRIEGNDHVVELNDIRNAVRESDDQGAIDMWRNPTYRGIVLRYNRFTDIGRVGAGAMAHGQAAIRPDDAISGVLIYGNVFVRASRGRFGAVQMNSGRDNIIANNLFIECAQGITGGWNAGNGAWQELRASKPPPDFITSALYLSRYPAMATMLTTSGNNYAWRNVFYRSGATGDPGNMDYGQRDPGFVDAAKGDWRLKPDAAP